METTFQQICGLVRFPDCIQKNQVHGKTSLGLSATLERRCQPRAQRHIWEGNLLSVTDAAALLWAKEGTSKHLNPLICSSDPENDDPRLFYR